MHVFKSFGREEGFQTLPKTVKMQKTRLSQQMEYINWVLGLENFERDVAKLRVEFTIRKRGSLITNLVWFFHQGIEYMEKFEKRVFTKEEYVTEAQRLLSLVRHSSGVTGLEHRQLNQREKDISAHSMNAIGICTKDIKMAMIRVGRDGRYDISAKVWSIAGALTRGRQAFVTNLQKVLD